MTTTDKTAADRMRRKRQRDKAAREQPAPIMYERADWVLFVNPATLPQKAGCAPEGIGATVLKELADNALDAGSPVKLEIIQGGVRIADHGPGIDPGDVPRLFAVNRPLISSKLKRLPTRGMLGNGLRAVMGAVAAHGGKIAVTSRGRRQDLDVNKATGETVVVKSKQAAARPGTTVEITFPSSVPFQLVTDKAETSILIAGKAKVYGGPSLPQWYTASDLHQLMAQVTPASTPAGTIITDIFGTTCNDARSAKSLTLDDVKEIHGNILRDGAARGAPIDIGCIGRALLPSRLYAKANGVARIEGKDIPYCVEAWASCERARETADTRNIIFPIMNLSQTMAPILCMSGPGGISLDGCGLEGYTVKGPKRALYSIMLSVITPYLQIMGDGKLPYLLDFHLGIIDAIQKAAGAAYRMMVKPKGTMTQVDAAYQVMEGAYMKASDNGLLPAKARQIMYAARGDILRLAGVEKFSDKTFTQLWLPDYLNGFPQRTDGWDVVYDARGNFHEPHTSQSVPLGTIQVRTYLGDRPPLGAAVTIDADTLYPTHGPKDRFRNVLFVEKEGFDELWQAVALAERYDLAIMSTKGMSNTAARKLLDRLAPQVDRIFVLHDFDKSGFSILGTLGTDSRRYEFENPVNVVDLGLRLDDVNKLGLESEPVELGNADPDKMKETLERHGATHAETKFLIDKSHRVELNAMTSRQLVDFVEAKLQEHGVEKIVPGDATLEAHARRLMEQHLTKNALAKIQASLAKKAGMMPLPSNLAGRVRKALKDEPTLSWDRALAGIIT